MLGTIRDYPAKNPDAFSIVQRGRFVLRASVPLFAGKRILTPEGKDGDANGAVIKELIDAGELLAKGTLRHSYPHTWRSKAPVIFRATPQWFAAMDKPFKGSDGKTLRAARDAGDRATPNGIRTAGENRIGSMVEGRPDWVLSRQRAWGVPLAIFVHKKTGEILQRSRRQRAHRPKPSRPKAPTPGSTSPPSRFLGNDRNPDDYEQVQRHSRRLVRFRLDACLHGRTSHRCRTGRKKDRADLYLEGSDQHRGWFQSSLLESCGTTRPRAVSRRC